MKWFAIFFIPFSVGTMGYVIGELTVLVTKHRMERSQAKVISQHITLRKLEAMDTDGDGEVDILEFVEFMLLALEKVDKGTIDQKKKQFRRLDVDQSGTLEKSDLVQLAKQSSARTISRSRHKSPMVLA